MADERLPGPADPDGDQQDEQPRRPCSPEQRYESEGGLRDGLPRRGAGIVVVKEKVETDA